MNEAMVDRAADFEEALRLIAKNRTPCVACGKPHEQRSLNQRYISWADPDDGHPYNKMAPASFAAKVLAS